MTVTRMGAGKPLPQDDEKDSYVVEFEGHDDPEYPQNWQFGFKYVSPYLGIIFG
jgi:hypothetical protein